MPPRRNSRPTSPTVNPNSNQGCSIAGAQSPRFVGSNKPNRTTTAKPARETVTAEDRALTFERRRQYRDAYRKLIDDLDANYFITFNFGYRIKPPNAFDRMKGFCAALEREALGRKWYKHSGDERLVVIGCAEHLDSNSHWHAVARVPMAIACVLETGGEEIWLNYAKRGQLWVERSKDQNKVRNYSTKRLHQVGALDKVFIYCPYPQKR
jgi:hypothetical protein